MCNPSICGCSVTTSMTWPSVRWRPRWKRAIIDAMYTQSKPFQQSPGGDGQVRGDRGPLPISGLALQVANIPAAITCTDAMAEKHPELAVTFMKGMIRVGRWANEHKHAAAVILDKQTYYRGRRAYLPEASRTSTSCPTCRLRTWLCRDRQELHAEPRLHQE